MNIINIEIINILLILFIIADYSIKYRKKFDINSFIWFSECLSIILLSLTNICLFYSTSFVVQTWFLCIGYVFAMLPILLYLYYLNINYMNKKINSNLLLIYFICYVLCVIIFFTKCSLDANINYISQYTNHYIFVSFIILPILCVLAKIIYSKTYVSFKIYFALIFPIVGLLLDTVFSNSLFITFSYSLTALLLYMFKYDRVINKDSLTGAKNRRYFDNYIYLQNKKYAVFMIDVDEFKSINDTYGHDKGDLILKDIVNVLKESIRTTDSVIRLGGDEFAIISSIKNDNDIKVINNRIDNNIIKYNSSHDINISISIGYGIYTSEDDFSVFLKSIDKKMYKSKQSKKNEKQKA